MDCSSKWKYIEREHPDVGCLNCCWMMGVWYSGSVLDRWHVLVYWSNSTVLKKNFWDVSLLTEHIEVDLRYFSSMLHLSQIVKEKLIQSFI